jgi:hypothetical protein
MCYLEGDLMEGGGGGIPFQTMGQILSDFQQPFSVIFNPLGLTIPQPHSYLQLADDVFKLDRLGIV